MLAEHHEAVGGPQTFAGDVCLGAGGSIRSNGELCINFPVAGYQCIDIGG